MKCPFCEATNTSVKDSRDTDESRVIRRRRHCNQCNGRFTTFERIQVRELVVLKKTGAKRPFDRTKILKAIATALRKRNFTDDDIEKLTDNIVLELESSATREIKSRTIGKLIMQELAKIDPVAYIRFASVYKDFSDAQDFAKFISKIKN